MATFLNYFLWYPLLIADHLRVVMAARRGDVLDQIKEELVVSGGEARAEVNRSNQGYICYRTKILGGHVGPGCS